MSPAFILHSSKVQAFNPTFFTLTSSVVYPFHSTKYEFQIDYKQNQIMLCEHLSVTHIHTTTSKKVPHWLRTQKY